MAHNLNDIEHHSKILIAKYCPDFKFVWMNKKTVLGTCSSKRKEIALSKFHAAKNPLAVTKDVVLHEIAHALVGAKHGHDKVWKAMCIKIGAKPERCANIERTGHTWELHCSCMVHKRYRKPRMSTVFYSRCGKCRGTLTLKKVA